MINLSKFLRSIHITKFSFYLLILLIILSFSITFYLLILLSDELSNLDPKKLLFFLSIDVILVIILIGLLKLNSYLASPTILLIPLKRLFLKALKEIKINSK